MNTRTNNTIARFLTIVLVVLAIVVAIQQIAFVVAEAQLAEAQESLSSITAQVSEAQETNDTLQAYDEENYIEWRNAQGRLAYNGDGSGLVCYLTFDDGPSSLTEKNLAVLEEKGAVATWFCLGNTEDYPYLDLSLLTKIEEQGSAVGIHDWDQNDSYDYYKGDVDNYFDSDFYKAEEVLEEAVGHEINICRFAGGSPTIAWYNSDIADTLPQEMVERGYQYFDWNVSAGDSESSLFVNGSTPADVIVDNVLSVAETYAASNSPICVLMHDNPGKDTTTEALPEIIDGLKELGYTFDTLDYDTPGFYQTSILIEDD